MFGPEHTRSIGPWGTAARGLVGVGMLAAAAVIGISAVDAALGLLAFPLGITGVLALRGRDARALRLTSPEWCCVNIGIGAVGFVFLPAAALLFVGTAMLLAAARGYAGCEIFAVSNWLRRRDDEIACPVFSPIDHAERRVAAGKVAP